MLYTNTYFLVQGVLLERGFLSLLKIGSVREIYFNRFL